MIEKSDKDPFSTNLAVGSVDLEPLYYVQPADLRVSVQVTDQNIFDVVAWAGLEVRIGSEKIQKDGFNVFNNGQVVHSLDIYVRNPDSRDRSKLKPGMVLQRTAHMEAGHGYINPSAEDLEEFCHRVEVLPKKDD